MLGHQLIEEPLMCINKHLSKISSKAPIIFTDSEDKRNIFFNVPLIERLPLYNVRTFFNYRYNLGFLVETELQVYKHLNHQILSLSKVDYAMMFILKKMLQDEVKHSNNAIILRSKDLPVFVKNIMDINSFFMLNSASYI
jgi:hypothetical protein